VACGRRHASARSPLRSSPLAKEATAVSVLAELVERTRILAGASQNVSLSISPRFQSKAIATLVKALLWEAACKSVMSSAVRNCPFVKKSKRTMNHQLSLEELWNALPSEERVFDPDLLPELPVVARHYLEHAIAPGTRLASAVRLRMHGEIKLGPWLPFTAEQVIHRDRGMIWRATVRKNGIPIHGSDRIVDGEGSMQWKLFGLFSVMKASGPDITRSTLGRVQVESIWLPSLFCHSDLAWTETDSSQLHARLTLWGEVADLDFTLEKTGQIKTTAISRWGNPERGAFHFVNFGGIVEEEGTFEGYTIPTRIRAGWYFGTDRFESGGEFFRASIDGATFR